MVDGWLASPCKATSEAAEEESSDIRFAEAGAGGEVAGKCIRSSRQDNHELLLFSLVMLEQSLRGGPRFEGKSDGDRAAGSPVKAGRKGWPESWPRLVTRNPFRYFVGGQASGSNGSSVSSRGSILGPHVSGLS
jgi:hypothetical protein